MLNKPLSRRSAWLTSSRTGRLPDPQDEATRTALADARDDGALHGAAVDRVADHRTDLDRGRERAAGPVRHRQRLAVADRRGRRHRQHRRVLDHRQQRRGAGHAISQIVRNHHRVIARSPPARDQ